MEQLLQRWVLQLTAGVNGGVPATPSAVDDVLASGQGVTRSQALTAHLALSCLPSAVDSTLVKRVLFADLARLCLFFGRDVSEKPLLLLMFTFLNDRC